MFDIPLREGDVGPIMASEVRITDGQWDFSGGVDSGRVTTAKSDFNPNGLPRNMLAWLGNATVRGGGITCRLGWNSIISSLAPLGLWQGGIIYKPDFAFPYLICSIAGRIYKVDLLAPFTVVDLSAIFGLTNPPAIEQAYFVQGEQFVIIQAGDYGLVPVPTLPLFWDGSILRRSKGITDPAMTYPMPGVNEIPAATCMDYFQGRIWYAQGRNYSATDIVFNHNSGTIGYAYRDSILNVTESPLCFGGDGFSVPSQAGNIRALKHTTNMDATLGEGDLYIFTLETVWKATIPTSRQDWIDLTLFTDASKNNAPRQTLVQDVNGTYGERSVISMNGDLFYRSIIGINSLMVSLRYFTQWGNRTISSNENRVFQYEDRSQLHLANGINFDNRLWQTCLPIMTDAGTAWQGIVPLDFDVISSFGSERSLPPAWEGMYEGLHVLQMFTGNFGGLTRAFAVVISQVDNSLQVWEFTSTDRFDDAFKPAPLGDKRIVWFLETPAYTWQKEYELKELYSGELFFDKVFGTVLVQVDYRVDSNPCWQFWHREEFCVARSSCEDVVNPVCYPEQPYREGYKMPMVLPLPPMPSCNNQSSRRPMNRGYQFQLRITVKGWARLRGIIPYAIPVQKEVFGGLNC